MVLISRDQHFLPFPYSRISAGNYQQSFHLLLPSESGTSSLSTSGEKASSHKSWLEAHPPLRAVMADFLSLLPQHVLWVCLFLHTTLCDTFLQWLRYESFSVFATVRFIKKSHVYSGKRVKNDKNAFDSEHFYKKKTTNQRVTESESRHSFSPPWCCELLILLCVDWCRYCVLRKSPDEQRWLQKWKMPFTISSHSYHLINN